jgi:hypothetical protein
VLVVALVLWCALHLRSLDRHFGFGLPYWGRIPGLLMIAAGSALVVWWRSGECRNSRIPGESHASAEVRGAWAFSIHTKSHASTLIWAIPRRILSTDESAMALWQKLSAIALSDMQSKRTRNKPTSAPRTYSLSSR